MKTFNLLSLMLCLMFYSCQKENPLTNNHSSERIDVSALPNNAKSYITNNYANSAISSAYKQSSGSTIVYQAKLAVAVDVFFNKSGQFLAASDDDGSNDQYVSVSSLPNSIVSYIQNNYGNLSIREVEINYHPNGTFSYEVEFTNGVELYFAEDGSFIASGHDINDDSNSNHINPQDLPSSILTYIQTNHPGASISKAEVKTNIDGSIIKFEIELSDGSSLNFDANGNYFADDSHSSGGFEDHIDISFTDLPSNSQNFINANYPGVGFESIRKKLYIDGSIMQYEVELANDTEITFAPDGSVIEIKD